MQRKWSEFLENADAPCCAGNPSHRALHIGLSAMLWSFAAGARSGNLNIPGLNHDPVPMVTDEEIDKSIEEFVTAKREQKHFVRGRVDEVIQELGLEIIEHDGISGVMVKDERQLQELLGRLAGNREKEEPEPPRGMYL